MSDLLDLTTVISVGRHLPELEENVQSQAEHQTEETEGCELGRVAAGNARSGLHLQGAGYQVVEDDEDVEDDDDRRDLAVIRFEAGGKNDLDCDGEDEEDESEGL